MSQLTQDLQLDMETTVSEIEDLIRQTLNQLNRDGAVIGLSGGLDSAVAAFLTVRSLGIDKVHLMNLPEKDSKPIHQKHAKIIAETLGIRLITKSITSILKASKSYKFLPIRYVPNRKVRGKLVELGRRKFLGNEDRDLLEKRLNPIANSWIARGNAYSVTKHRMRMIVLYQYADVNNLMVVGAANKTEWLTGTFSKWGVDHCSDIMPLLHLYRSQLEQLAEHLDVPEFIRNKPADPDIMPGIVDKGELLGDTVVVDQILNHLENQKNLSNFTKVYGEEAVNKIISLYENSKHMRESPYSL